MQMPDVNVLLYAHREDEAVHTFYHRFVEDLVNSPEPFGLSVLVVVGFVRIVTHPKIYKVPTPLGLALASMEALADHPGCRVLSPGPRHLGLFTTLCRASHVSGKSVADAQHAALAIEHGCTFVTRDADFATFAGHGLRWQHLTL